MYCSPKKNNESFTCFSKPSLEKMINAYNTKLEEKNKIKIQGKSKKQLWSSLREKLSNNCNTEWCWIDQDFVHNLKDDEIEHFTFRPKMPTSWKKNKYTWLTTRDINQVMIQYEKQYNDFLFIGPVPADCPAKIMCELSDINIDNLIKNKKQKIGIVFNLDNHDQPGSHWVGSFIDIEKNRVYYYDSYGEDPPDLIKKFLISTADKIFDVKGNVKVETNIKRHQFGGSECGIYSMNFILECLKEKALEDIVSKNISDKAMNELRKYLYRHE